MPAGSVTLDRKVNKELIDIAAKTPYARESYRLDEGGYYVEDLGHIKDVEINNVFFLRAEELRELFEQAHWKYPQWRDYFELSVDKRKAILEVRCGCGGAVLSGR